MARFLATMVLMTLSITGAPAQSHERAPWHDPSRCSQNEAMQADAATDHMKDWAAIYRVFERYVKCDDGAIAEGNSDAGVKLLALNWPRVEELSRLIQKDPQFGDFVIAHIDETADFSQEKAIVVHARDHCPSGLNALCMRLEKAAANP